MERQDLLPLVAATLANDASASMGDIAARIGVSRTTLHRNFSNRDALTNAVARFAIDEVSRIYDAVGLDDRPAREVLEAMGDEVVNLATAYWLLWATPPITDAAEMRAEATAFEERFQRFAARAQTEGVLRTDVPAPVISFSIGSQAFAMAFAVREGYLGTRAVKELFVATVLSGIGAVRVPVEIAP